MLLAMRESRIARRYRRSRIRSRRVPDLAIVVGEVELRGWAQELVVENDIQK